MNKIIIKLFVPKIDREYDVFIPTNKRISSVIALLVKAINELSMDHFHHHKCQCYIIKSQRKVMILI